MKAHLNTTKNEDVTSQQKFDTLMDRVLKVTPEELRLRLKASKETQALKRAKKLAKADTKTVGQSLKSS